VWAAHLGTSPDDAYRAAFEVDFDKCVVVAILKGDQINVRGVEVNSLLDNQDSTILRFTQVYYQTANVGKNKPPDKPFAFVVLPKTNKQIILEEDVYTVTNEPPKWKEIARLGQNEGEEKDKTPTPLQIKKLTPKEPFEWTRDEKKQFVTNLKTIKEGDKIEDVVTLLGPPFSAEYSGPKKASEPRNGIAVEYYLKKIGTGSNELQDQYILLVFDTAGKFKKIMTNIFDLPVEGAVEMLGGSRLGNLEDEAPKAGAEENDNQTK